MNRREFFRSTLTALAGFTILPGAGRIWKAERKIIQPMFQAADLAIYHDLPFIIAKCQIEYRIGSDGYAWERLLKARKFLNVTPPAKIHLLRS